MAESNGEPGNQPKPTRPGGGAPKMPARGMMSWFFFLMLAMSLVFFVGRNMSTPTPISYSQFMTLVDNGQIVELTFRDDVIRGERKLGDGLSEQQQENPYFQVAYSTDNVDALMQSLRTKLPDVEMTYERPSLWLEALLTILPWLLMIAFVWFFIFRQIRGAGGAGGMLGNFGRSRHRVTSKEHTNVSFGDVAGINEAKEEVQEIIEFLRCPKKFQRLGARIPRGVLLVGEPGCGKTLLAKAIAGEADVPFFSISGSDFVEMFVGVGASRVRDLFKQAKESSPCIIFLDEIDAVGRRRGASFGGGGHDEREQTLNAILVEMDGFDTNDQVIVVAATNRADVLDPALVRPGRFDRQVFVSMPDVQGRYEILKVHARKIKMGPNVDLRRLARSTPAFSGADMAAVINEAALLATMLEKEYVEQDDLEEARDKVRWGRAKKSRVVDEQDRIATACHEGGHALVQALEKDADPLHKVSIVPRGPYAGATFTLPEKDRQNYSRNYVLAQMRILCAGRIAEEILTGDVNTGASADIRQATDLARQMVVEWGMNDRMGFVSYADEATQNAWMELPANHDYSDDTARAIDEEIHKLIDQSYADAKRIVMENKPKVEAIKEALLSHETITGDEVNALIRGETLDRPTVTDLLAADDDRNPKVGTARPIPAEKPEPEDLSEGTLPQPG
ncbi:MAG: ATP-dependent zinc metalloprotease FtsH [Planctomycetes bacterium]|nr:ATP-dependent zinc metalloprotease FtsH [Planctomycetota bacterium]